MSRTIFFNGKVITMDDHMPRAQAIIVEDGIIKAVGSDRDMDTLQREEDVWVNMEEKAILPGFIATFLKNKEVREKAIEDDRLIDYCELIKKAITSGYTTIQIVDLTYEEYEKFNADLMRKINLDKEKIDIALYIKYQDAKANLSRFLSIKQEYETYIKIAGCSINIYNIEERELFDILKNCIENNWPFKVICDDNNSCEQFLKIYAKALEYERGEYKLRPEVLLPDEICGEYFDVMNLLDINPSFMVDNIYFRGDYYYEKNRKNNIAQEVCPVKDAAIRGINFTFYKTIDSQRFDTFFSIHNSVNRKTKTGRVVDLGENLSLPDAISAATINEAFQLFEEKEKGSIKPGKIADFTILDKSPYEVRKEELHSLKVVGRIKNGLYYKD